MSRLRLQLKPSVRGRVSLEGAVPDRWLGLKLAEIIAWPIEVDRRPATVGEVMEVTDGQRDQWLISGDLQHCDFIAAGMRSGEIVVEGSVGDYVASGMRGGSVVVQGDAGDYAASSLRNGRVTIMGDVGTYAAAAAAPQTHGMSGGELIIQGSADQWLASRMRRGLVVVYGDVASGCATRMIAGTLVICGRAALPLGSGMARGTLLLLDPQESLMSHGLVGFTDASPCQLSFLPILLQQIAPLLPFELSSGLVNSRWRRCLGDRADLGLGEVLLREHAAHRAVASHNPS
jgi:formylmethanofuran dehydrogenase subunit C